MTASTLLVIALFSHPVAATAAPSYDEVHARLAAQGPRATVESLSKAGKFEFVLNRIGSGDRTWIGLVPKLARGADGANAEGLGIALAEALPKNPRTVLAALDLRGGPILGPERVCSAPFIEPKPGVLSGYKDRAIKAVTTVRQPALARAAGACLTRLRAIKN